MTDGFPWLDDDTKLAQGLAWLVSAEFDLLERHRREMFAGLNRFMDKADDDFTEYKKQWQLLRGEDVDEYDAMEIEFQTATQDIPRLQWNAQFLIAFSVFEHLLCKLADHAQTRFKQKVSYRDFGGNGFEPAYNYLKKVAGLGGTAFQTSQWQTVQVFKQLRNCLAHTRGEFVWSEQTSNLGQRMKLFQGWTVDNPTEGAEAEITLSPEFVGMAILTMRGAAIIACTAEFNPE